MSSQASLPNLARFFLVGATPVCSWLRVVHVFQSSFPTSLVVWLGTRMEGWGISNVGTFCCLCGSARLWRVYGQNSVYNAQYTQLMIIACEVPLCPWRAAVYRVVLISYTLWLREVSFSAVFIMGYPPWADLFQPGQTYLAIEYRKALAVVIRTHLLSCSLLRKLFRVLT